MLYEVEVTRVENGWIIKEVVPYHKDAPPARKWVAMTPLGLATIIAKTE